MASLPRETPQSRGWYNVGGAAEFSTTPAVTWAPPQVKTGPSSSDEPMVVMSGAFPWNVDDTLVGVFGFEVVLDNMWAGTMGGRLNCSSCHDGYASEADGCPASCSSECTGGALCTSTNTCTCPFGFADSRFNSCAGNSSICTLNGAGNVQSLTESSSGAYLNLSTGVYNMFESDSMEIGVHVWKCANDRSCVDAVSFRALPSGDKIEIR